MGLDGTRWRIVEWRGNKGGTPLARLQVILWLASPIQDELAKINAAENTTTSDERLR
jgi:hypothetical protein